MKTASIGLVIALTALLAGTAQAQDYYASAYGSAATAHAPQRTLRTTQGLPRMNQVTGRIVSVQWQSRTILVRDHYNRIHTFTVPARTSLAPRADFHRDPRALQAMMNRVVRVAFVGSLPGPERQRAIDILPAN